jgi:hypothetical protein
MSIASALIHATMSNVTRDMKQLEHWLGSLAAPLAAVPSMPSEVSSTTSDIMRSLHAQQTLLEQLHTTLQAQQHTIHHLTDRIQILEESRAAPEEWMDPVEEEEEIVPIYIVRKTEEPAFQEIQESLIQITGGSIWKRDVQEVQEVQEEEIQEEEEEEIQEEEIQEEVQEEEVQEVPVKVEPVEKEPVKVEPVKVEPVKVEPVEKEPVKVEAPVVEEPVKVEQQEVQEEEEGMELEVITFQGVSYYKDEEGFIYSIDEDEQPSEKAIGYWKKKAQAVAFYRSE